MISMMLMLLSRYPLQSTLLFVILVNHDDEDEVIHDHAGQFNEFYLQYVDNAEEANKDEVDSVNNDEEEQIHDEKVRKRSQ